MWTEHRMYDEFQMLLNDDVDFADMWDNTESDFWIWVLDYEVNRDWE